MSDFDQRAFGDSQQASVDPETRLIDWPPGQPAEGIVGRATHRLNATGLFTDQALLEIFDSHEPSELLVYRMGDDHTDLDSFEYGGRGLLSAQELLTAVREGRLWLNIIHVNYNHQSFRELVDAMYDELEETCPGFVATRRNANLLVSSPAAKVFFHADAPLNMLWHLRGRKRVWVYPSDERFAPPEWVEKIFSRESDDDLPYDPSFEEYAVAYDLEPGQMLTWPQNTPHRVDNVDGLNVSLTTEHYTPLAMRKRMTFLANRYLRKWFGLRTRSTRIDGAGALARRTAFRIARRFPGLREYREGSDAAVFDLSGDSPIRDTDQERQR